MKTKVRGCGATYCKFNNCGVCQLDGVILGERGECLINKPDISKMEEQTRIEQYVMQQKETSNKESETRRIGFYEEPIGDQTEESNE